MLPKPQKPKAAPKPKPPKAPAEPQPDFVIDESDIQSPAKQKRLLVAPHKHFIRFWRWWLSLGRNQRFAFLAGVLLVFGALAVAWFYFIQPDSAPKFISASSHHKAKPKPPPTAPSPLTGLAVDPALAKRPVTGIMIENSDAARPQSGLQDAGVVYEAIAEAGITRFLALFQEATPQYIGPVRSLRPYYIDYAAPFQASIAHVGGSPDALAEVSNGGFRNLDEFANGPSFYRVSSRYAPHNVYTDFTRLDALNQRKGYTTSQFTSWPRKPDKKLAAPTAKNIDFTLSSPDYYVHYDYDAASNTYMRSEGGAAHLDYLSAADKTGVQLHPKVVIALVVPQSRGALDFSGAYYTDYQTDGSGTAFIFQDGGITETTWQKAGTTSQISFSDANSQPVKLDAGQTWITLIGDTGKLSYKP